MNDLGQCPTAIAKELGRSHNTVIKFLESDVYNDPAISGIVEKIKENEINDLYLLGAKGRKRLHELVDKGDSKMIETIALVDRVFQQRRLLEGKSTENIHSITRLIQQVHEETLREAREIHRERQKEEGRLKLGQGSSTRDGL